MDAGDRFFDRPVLNSPYEYPSQHWELDDSGQPTNRILDHRRRVSFITPIPRPKKGKGAQKALDFDEEAHRLATEDQQYELAQTINSVRNAVDRWRALPDPGQWGVTPETARLLQHWRHHRFNDIRPFFCQVEAVETAIWLTEVAPTARNCRTPVPREHLEMRRTKEANPAALARLALKLATGAGKTTVMAMLIAWQTINAVRRPNSPSLHHGASWSSPPASPSRTGCACSSPTTRTATTRAGSWCRATCWAISTGRRSSSPTSTLSSAARRWRSPGAVAPSSRVAVPI